MLNKTFGQLTVIKLDHIKNYRKYFTCECACGTTTIVAIDKLNSGHTKSCGCLGKQNAKKHGDSKTKLYKIWSQMIQRCTNPKATKYDTYGAVGITVDPLWLDYPTFKDWAMSNGYKEGLSIDRVDGTKNYTPINCRWATPTIQAHNQKPTLRNTTGYKHISVRNKKYIVRILQNWIGTYDTLDEALNIRNHYYIDNNLIEFIEGSKHYET